MSNKYYAVKIGKTPGIYRTWDECKDNVHQYPGAIYKSFKTLDEANEYMGIDACVFGEANETTSKPIEIATTSVAIHCDGEVVDISSDKIIQATPYAFVDGSFNATTGVYGYGGFLVANNKKYFISGSGDDSEMASMRNVAGEVLGSQAAIAKALELNLKEITIYYDYAGIEMWALGKWKRNKKGTIAYYEYISKIRYDVDLYFVKVKGHSGVEGNEEADALAKKAVGLE